MTSPYRVGIIFLLMLSFAAPSVFARSVYLKDGSVIENVRSVWREQGKVQVLVNRDVLLTLGTEEVNLDKTFHSRNGSAKRTVHAKVRKAAAPAKPAFAPVDEPAPGANPSAQKTADASGPAAAKNPAAAPQAAVKDPQPAAKSPAAVSGNNPAPVASTSAPSPGTAPKPQVQVVVDQSPEAAKKALQEAAVQAMMQDGGKAMFASAGSVLLIFAGVILVMVLIFWKVYVKAGEAGWKSLIPIYNMIVLLRMAGRPAWWCLLLFLPLVNVIFLTIMHIDLAKRFGKETWFGFGLTFASPVFFAILAFDNSVYHDN